MSWRIGDLLVIWHRDIPTKTLVIGEVTKVELQTLHFKTIFVAKDPNHPFATTFASGKLGSHYTVGILQAERLPSKRAQQKKMIKRVIG